MIKSLVLILPVAADSSRSRAAGAGGVIQCCLVPRVDDVGRVRRHSPPPNIVEDGAAALRGFGWGLVRVRSPLAEIAPIIFSY